MVENSKFGELYEKEIISDAYKTHRNAIVKLTTQNKRIDAKSLTLVNAQEERVNKVEKQQIICERTAN